MNGPWTARGRSVECQWKVMEGHGMSWKVMEGPRAARHVVLRRNEVVALELATVVLAAVRGGCLLGLLDTLQLGTGDRARSEEV